MSLEVMWATYRQRRSIRVRNQIALANKKLTYTVAHRYAGQCAETVEDLAQIGMIGLLKAIERFDSDAGVAFSSFAVPYVSGEIQHFLRDHFGSVKIPRQSFEQTGKVKKVQRQMAKAGRVIHVDEAASACGLSEERWAWTKEAVQRRQCATLDEVLEIAAPAEHQAEQEQLRSALLSAVAYLPRQERRFITEVYFANIGVELLAKREHISVAEVEATLKTGLDKLRARLEETYAECS